MKLELEDSDLLTPSATWKDIPVGRAAKSSDSAYCLLLRLTQDIFLVLEKNSRIAKLVDKTQLDDSKVREILPEGTRLIITA